MPSTLSYHNIILKSLKTAAVSTEEGMLINLFQSLELIENAMHISDEASNDFLSMLKDALNQLNGKPANPKDINKLNEIVNAYERRVLALYVTKNLSGDDIIYLSDVISKPGVRRLLLKIKNHIQPTERGNTNLYSLEAFDLAAVVNNRVVLTKKGLSLVKLLEEK